MGNANTSTSTGETFITVTSKRIENITQTIIQRDTSAVDLTFSHIRNSSIHGVKLLASLKARNDALVGMKVTSEMKNSIADDIASKLQNQASGNGINVDTTIMKNEIHQVINSTNTIDQVIKNKQSATAKVKALFTDIENSSISDISGSAFEESLNKTVIDSVNDAVQNHTTELKKINDTSDKNSGIGNNIEDIANKAIGTAGAVFSTPMIIFVALFVCITIAIIVGSVMAAKKKQTSSFQSQPIRPVEFSL